MTTPRTEISQGMRSLASWAAGTKPDQIPPEILKRAVRVLADDLSAIIGARKEPEVFVFHSKTLEKLSEKQATVFRGGRPRTDRISAAVANAVAADWLELDEGYRLTPCHAGLYVIPALLAEAEARNLSLRDMLRALVLGYEIVTRVARSFIPAALNMQSHGRYSAVGAAASVGLSKNLTHEKLIEAISAAVTLTGPSPRNHLQEGILVRNVWPAAGAWSGMMAVEWAECGIAGDPGAFHDVYATVLGGKPQPQMLTAGLGAGSEFHWAIEDGYTKVYACCQHLHSAVEAAVGLRKQLLSTGSLEDISSIQVETHELALPLVNPKPHTTLAAKFSMSHAMAAALATGSGGASAFAADTLAEPAIAQLRGRVSVKRWAPELPPPHDRPARVTVELKNGKKIAGECLSARGGPDLPLPVSVVLDKMTELASPAYPRIRPIFEELLELEGLERGWSDVVAEICK